MHSNIEEAEPSFKLKRKGDFGQALTAYAREYSSSLRSENSFIADICFEQMFDICLLDYLKEEHHFATKEELLKAIETKLLETLRRADAYEKDFGRRFASCKLMLFPKGRATSRFSVDARWLL